MTKIAANFAAEFSTALANTDAPTNVAEDNVKENLTRFRPVSYTHLTLPTIYSV